MFCYLPFIHAEDAESQQTGHKLFTKLSRDVSPLAPAPRCCLFCLSCCCVGCGCCRPCRMSCAHIARSCAPYRSLFFLSLPATVAHRCTVSARALSLSLSLFYSHNFSPSLSCARSLLCVYIYVCACVCLSCRSNVHAGAFTQIVPAPPHLAPVLQTSSICLG